MSVEDYVRIKNKAGWCCIGKIVNINEFREPDMKYCIDIQGEDYIFVPEDMIAKSSPNIIDLIEVGDYVNGKKVIDTYTDYIFDYSEEFKVVRFSETDILHDVKHIKSIVTKEQFESMEYKVGE